MALMERVGTLIRANLNDLIEKAEDPGKMLKQVMLDMENQLMQVKTQVAIAVAGQHLLVKKQKEHADKGTEWFRKAELAVAREQDDLARTALERSLAARTLAENYRQQIEDQTLRVESLKAALGKLQDKLVEARSKSELLAAQHRRARAMMRAGEARLDAGEGFSESTLQRVQDEVARLEAVGVAKTELNGDSDGERLAALDKQDQVERLLAQLKLRKG